MISSVKFHRIVGLTRLLNVSTGLVSDMLNYKKGMSKETIRILEEQERPGGKYSRPFARKLPVTLVIMSFCVKS